MDGHGRTGRALGATGCSKNEGDGGGGGGSSNASKLEEYAMTPEWIN